MGLAVITLEAALEVSLASFTISSSSSESVSLNILQVVTKFGRYNIISKLFLKAKLTVFG